MINSTCSFFTSSKITFKNYVVLCSFLLISSLSFGQQVIGSFPYMNGGFEGQTSGVLATVVSATNWTRQNQSGASSSIVTATPRSGVNYATVTSVATTSRNLQSPQGTTGGPTSSTSYVVQYFVKNTASVNGFQAGVTTNGTSNPVYSSAAVLAINTNWTLKSYVLSTTATSVTTNGIGIAGRAQAGSFDVDDFVIYPGTALDNTAPLSPGTVSVSNPTTSSLDISWGAASGGVDGGGYVVVRYASNPNADNDPNQNGIYAVGNTTTNGTGSLTGTVVYVGTGLSFTDSSLSSGMTYYYKVYTIDKAFNYSNEISGNGTTSSGFTISWCNLQFPTSQTIAEGSTFNVYGQVYAAGLTEAAGQGTNLNAWVGYSATNSNPNSGGWTWISSSYNTNVGDNDEFVGSLGAGIIPGTYYYAYRYQIGSGAFVYGGTGGVWNNDSATLTVNSNLVNWCNVQYPLSGTITQGDVYNVYSKVYDPGITNNAGQGSGISGWIGYSTTNSNPNTGSWTWVSASFQGDAGNDDEYFANIATGLAPGTYYYASRYQKTGSTEYKYGGTNGVWTNDSGVLTVNAAVPVLTAGTPTGTYNVAFSYNIIATNSPTSYAISSGTLPGGLTLNTTTGEIAGTPTAAGTFNVDFTATNSGGTSAAQTIVFTINKANQTITFGALAGVPVGTAPYALTATASSGLTVSYLSSNTDVVTVSGNTITIVGAGTANITASQAGNANYNAAANIIQAITVYDVASQLTFVGVPTTGNVGANLTSFTVEARRPDNSVDTFYTGNVTISKASGIGNLTGTLTVAAVAGVANFSAAQFDAASTYTLYADSGSLAQITSGNIVITLVPTVIAQFDFTPFTLPTASVVTVKDVNVNVTDFAISAGTLSVGQITGTVFPNEPYVSGSGGYTSTTQAGAKNFNFTINANAGYQIEVTSFEFNSLSTGAGPSAISFDIASGTSTFTTNAPDTVLLPVNQTITGVTNLTTIPLLIQGWLNGSRTSSGTGNFRIDDVIVKGYVTCLQPIAYTVTGGGAICVGSAGIPIGLSNSQVGIIYQLIINGSNAGSPVAGTGSAISFGNQNTIGTYTVEALNSACSLTLPMTGSVSISAGATTTWSGSPASWDNGAPTSAMIAIISADYSEVADINACSLTVNNNAIVTIPSGNVISLFGGLTVESGSSFVLNSNAVLLQDGTTNQNSGNITVNRSSQDLMRLDYTMWSSPVEGQVLASFSPLTMANRFYTYSSSGNVYTAIANTNSFTVGQGYLIRMPDNHPTSPTAWNGAFIGKPNSGTITIGLSTAGTGFNAVGNPYPSPISIATFLSENSSVIGSDLYFWRKTNGAAGSAYITFSGGSFSDGPHTNNTIQPGQGFIVQATNAADLTFNNTQRNANNGVFYRNGNVTQSEDNSRIWLNLKSNDVVIGQMAVGYRAEATNSIDADFDAEYINDSALALNSIVEGTELAVQHRATFTASDVVPLSFKTTTAGTYAIAINDVDGLFTNADQNIYLKDNLLNVEHDLRSAPYSFVSEIGVFANRFEIVYQSALSVEVPTFGNGVVVYSKNKTIEINSGTEVMSSVKVLDIRGSIVAEKVAVNSTNTSIDLTYVANQVLIIQITAENGQTVSRKVVH